MSFDCEMFGQNICAYIRVVRVWPLFIILMLLEDDNPLVRYSGAVSANILPMDKTTELVIPCLAAGKTIFLIVSHLPAPRANELIRNSSGTASNACWIVRIKIGKITIKIVNAPANNDLPLDPPFAIPNV